MSSTLMTTVTEARVRHATRGPTDGAGPGASWRRNLLGDLPIVLFVLGLSLVLGTLAALL